MLSETKNINDPVYGIIGLTDVEVRLLDTPVFQRLRSLRQLARVNYVFPGAEHSRFVHSLGVLSNMSKMTAHLNRCGELKEDDVRKLRVAALLHDIGHYPFSHLGEAAYGYITANQSAGNIVNGETPSLFSICDIASSHIKESAHHEKLGEYVVTHNKDIIKILKEFGYEPEEIGSIFTEISGTDNIVYSQLIHSSLDADRLDYLLRDSFQVGVKYGNVDLDYLVSLMRIIDNTILTDETRNPISGKILAFEEKGKHVIEHFLMARYFHYSQMVYHKTSVAFEGMIKAMFILLLSKGNPKYMFHSLDDIHKSINDDRFVYLFNDAFLEYDLYKFFEKGSDKDFNKLYDMYRRRKRPKVVFERKERHTESEESPGISILKNKLTRERDDISKIMGTNLWGYNIVSPAIEKIPDKSTSHIMDEAHYKDLVEAVKIYDPKTDKTRFLADDKSVTIRDLISKNVEFIRVYCMDPDLGDDDHRRITQEIENLIGK